MGKVQYTVKGWPDTPLFEAEEGSLLAFVMQIIEKQERAKETKRIQTLLSQGKPITPSPMHKDLLLDLRRII